MNMENTEINNPLGDLNTIINNTNLTINSNVSISYSIKNSCSYNILGESIEVDGSNCPIVAMYVSMINILGKTFYDEIKKQNIQLPKEISKFIDDNIVSWERNKKLDTIVNKSLDNI
jgi:hypothetical protein